MTPSSFHRGRRLRRTEALRSLVRETEVRPGNLVQPLFVTPGTGIRTPVGSMPGVERTSPDEAVRDAEALARLGVGGVILFGIPAAKDARGRGAWVEGGIIQTTLKLLADEVPELLLMTDVCLCEYTDHGHCGLLADDGTVLNDSTLELLARTAVSHARAGAQVVAPSDMMDGRVAALRQALDAEGFTELPILSYAAKYASAFYGPFRDAADSAPSHGDRRGYQMDPANGDEALREVAADLEEGADMVLVKPALPYLDIVHRVKEAFGVPTGAYQVSGEYAAILAAHRQGWLDGDRAMEESLLSIRRAGADFVVTYAARALANRRAGNI